MFKTHLSSKRIRHREGGSDPTKGVDHVGRQSIDYALYRSADVLRGRYDHRARQQQNRSKYIVQPEHRVVRLDVLPFEVGLQTP